MPRILTAAVLGLIVLTPLLVVASPGDVKINEKKIYYGDPDDFEKPGVIRIVKVFKAIPEYQEAKKKGKDDPEYYILLEKANEKFFTALERVADDKGYDLIGEVGAIKIKGKKVPEITSAVIDALPK
ncbi:MAG: hypothetical protein ACYS47_17515 [Planctomycetota bacterium]